MNDLQKISFNVELEAKLNESSALASATVHSQDPQEALAQAERFIVERAAELEAICAVAKSIGIEKKKWILLQNESTLLLNHYRNSKPYIVDPDHLDFVAKTENEIIDAIKNFSQE